MEFHYVVAGIVLGGLIAYYFSHQASRKLRAEADALRRETEDARHYVNALISSLEATGQIEVVRDEAGRPIQTKIIRLIKGIASEEEAVRLTATRDEPPEESPQSRGDGS